MPQPGAAPQGADPASSQGQGAGALKILAAITRLAQGMAQAFPATSPEAEEITKQVQNAAQKVIGGTPGEQAQPTPF